MSPVWKLHKIKKRQNHNLCGIPFSLIFILLICFKADAQYPVPGFKSVGMITGFGVSAQATVKRYQPIFLTGDFSWSFGKAVKMDFLNFYLEPQFNLARTMERLDIEFGINGGLRNCIRINSGFYFYQMLGAGPHYISAILENQANGFIFSDNLAFGIYKSFKKESFFLNLQFRIRHISNAGLKEPNGGVNSYNLLVGFVKIK